MIKTFDIEKTPLKGLMLLEASAGTGKTYALERMVARLVGDSGKPLGIEEILVVTFTNKAASEMKERIRSLLSERSADVSLSEEKRSLYRKAVVNFDKAPVYTIHGFCQMVLSSWPFESSSSFSQEINPEKTLEKEVIFMWLSSVRKPNVTPFMESMYKKAGSAEKLAEIIYSYLYDSRIPPDALVLPDRESTGAFIEFFYRETARKNYKNYQSAAEEIIKHSSADIIEKVFSVLKNQLKEKGGKFSRRPNYVLLENHFKACVSDSVLEIIESFFGNPSNSNNLLNHLVSLVYAVETIDLSMEGIPEDVYVFSENLFFLFREFRGYLDYSYEEGILKVLTEEYRTSAFILSSEPELKRKIAEAKEREGTWNYDDLIRRVAEKADGGGTGITPLTAAVRKRFKAALIDEFQDTDPLQWKIFYTFFGEKDAERTLILIGDAKQSIYGFRGTGLLAYYAAKSAVEKSSVYRLDTNYRSSGGLVEFSNIFFDSLFSTDNCSGEPAGFEPVRAGRKDNPVLLHGEDTGTPVTFIKASPGSDGKREFAYQTALSIRSLLDPDDPFFIQIDKDGGKVKRRLSASDIAVLVRNGKDEEEISGFLSALGIPSVKFKSYSVFAGEAGDALFTLLAAVENPSDVSGWKKVLLDMFFRLLPQEILTLEESGLLDAFCETGSSMKTYFLNGSSAQAFKLFFDFSVQTGEHLKREDLKVPWKERVLSGQNGLRLWHDWNQLEEIVQKKQNDGIKDISRLIKWLKEAKENGNNDNSEYTLRLEREDPSVRIITMHSSKGLEFPVVYLFGGFRTSRTPFNSDFYKFESSGKMVIDRLKMKENRDRHSACGWEEDKRLWYVAFTRASVKLFIPLPADGPLTLMDSLLYNSLADGAHEKIPGYLYTKKSGKAPDPVQYRKKISDKLKKINPELINIAESFKELSPLNPPAVPELSVRELPDENFSLRDPQTNSYSSLIRSLNGQDTVRPDLVEKLDRDTDNIRINNEESEKTVYPVVLGEEKGTVFGNFMHSLFELVFSENLFDIRGKDPRIIEKKFAEIAGRYYPSLWFSKRKREIINLVERTLDAEIPNEVPGVFYSGENSGKVWKIGNVPENNRRPEMEFHMAVRKTAQISFYEEEGLNAVLGNGLLKGYIDLLVYQNNKWWVVDWKTNMPPEETEKGGYYGQNSMDKIMNFHRYHLQYELYLLALCASLKVMKKRPVDWDREIGGAVYVFIRGIPEGGGNGLYLKKPDKKRIISLAESMGLDGLIL